MSVYLRYSAGLGYEGTGRDFIKDLGKGVAVLVITERLKEHIENPFL